MKKILVALDGSPRAETVLAQAVALAGLTASKVVLFRSFGLPPHMPDHVWALPEGSLIEALRADSAKYLEQCARAVPRELLGGTRVELGIPWQAVCAAARHENADMVIIGSHGYSGVDHLIGTTAAKIVNHIDRPVLVVRPMSKAAS